MSFESLLICAKLGDDTSRVRLLEMYRPMLLKLSHINGCLDEDLFQDLCLTLIRCIDQFVI